MAEQIQLDRNLVLNRRTPELTDAPTDIIPPVDRGDVTGLDEDHLRRYIMSAFRNMIADKRDYGWLEKKEWALKAYFGEKEEAWKHWPWEGASAFRVPLIPTITDTAWANVQSAIWSDPNGPIFIPGVGNEDIRPAKLLERFQNYQMMAEDEINFEGESDKHVFRTFLMGTGITKTMFDVRTGTIKIVSVDVENFYVPIDARGLQKDGTDILVHIIPLHWNDLQIRKAMKVYRDPDSILPGIGLAENEPERLRQTMDKISGLDMDAKVRRENYYIAEVHLSYTPPNSMRPRDLIVWMNPNGSKIQRVREKKDGKRPFEDCHAYPYSERFYSQGIPEKIRNCQEKVDYADKQYTDALDKANNSAAFVDDTTEFDRTRQQRVPGGIYPKGKGTTVEWEPQPPIERGFAQERALVWEMAERQTGVIDITQGRASSFGGKTLGELEIRAARADVRFENVYRRFGKWWNQVVTHVYELNYEHTPESKVEQVLGYSGEGYTFNELFPVKNGKLVKHNFQFSGRLQSDDAADRTAKIEYYGMMLKIPWVIENEANAWRASMELAEAYRVRNAQNVFPKPQSADILGINEFIQRVVSGQRDLKLRPGINTEQYIFEIQLFMKSGAFNHLEDWQKQMLADTLRRAMAMLRGELKAKAFANQVRQLQGAGAGMSGGMPGGILPARPPATPPATPEALEVF